MFTAGKTGLKAAMHHAPEGGGKERYVFYVMPHMAIDEEGKNGVLQQEGDQGESQRLRGPLPVSGRTARKSKINVKIDDEDAEESLLKRRLVEGNHLMAICPSLLELTKIARKVILEDLENAINSLLI